MRWKAPLNAFQAAFEGRLTKGRFCHEPAHRDLRLVLFQLSRQRGCAAHAHESPAT